MVAYGALGALLAAGIGLLSCFFGFRLFRIILALLGFLLGFSLGLTLSGGDQQVTAIIVGIILGIVGAVIFYALYFIGVALSGAVLGAFLAVTLMSALSIDVNALGVVLVVVGIILGAVVALAINKLMIILSTALSGAGGVIYGAAYFLPGVFLTIGANSVSPTLVGGVAWLILAVAGIVYQYRENKNRLASDKK
ncbi:MAG: DUF4203 domain-containing protein [Anaerolineaceae bacterium]|nr:DUF4203 domain-containing protein [Anaerolineaceae bacterium]